MTDEQVVQTLLLEVHRCIDVAAEESVAKLGTQRRQPAPAEGQHDPEALLVYPPDIHLSPEEDHALRSIQLSTAERSAIRKLIADGCSRAFFDFFNLVDATGDPEVKPPRETWLGAWLVAPKDDRDRELLHDGFFESYEEYDKATRGRRP